MGIGLLLGLSQKEQIRFTVTLIVRTLEQIASNIKNNPVKALLNSPFFIYDRNTEILSLVLEIRSGLTASVAERIISACLQRLDEYYMKIED